MVETGLLPLHADAAALAQHQVEVGGGLPVPGDGHHLVEEPPAADLLHRVTVSTDVAITARRETAKSSAGVRDRPTTLRFDIRRRTGVEMRLDLDTAAAPARELPVR
ncbi:hypothetical protein Vse01_47300 [Micromonospora sediminimaris]|uniref:Uncharacterized protein n=1 Tax=Micromonospora sediminimaris TaxID=547162 RepID=A0A9W5XLZ6_9ACTN|nr:hypothetical protein Vse01_47300 [Micromonospora sediminimaris]